MSSREGVVRTTPFSKSPTALGACVRLATTNAMSGSRMPTKTTSWSRISRAAAATMSSPRVNVACVGMLDSRLAHFADGQQWILCASLRRDPLLLIANDIEQRLLVCRRRHYFFDVPRVFLVVKWLA